MLLTSIMCVATRPICIHQFDDLTRAASLQPFSLASDNFCAHILFNLRWRATTFVHIFYLIFCSGLPCSAHTHTQSCVLINFRAAPIINCFPCRLGFIQNSHSACTNLFVLSSPYIDIEINTSVPPPLSALPPPPTRLSPVTSYLLLPIASL